MTEKTKWVLRWMATNGALIAVAEMAMYYESEGAMRLLRCFSWAMFVCSLFGWSAMKQSHVLERIARLEKSRVIPQWVGETISVAVGCWLI